MGQKTHPIGFRLGIVKTWNSRWFEEGRYRQWLHEDLELHLDLFLADVFAETLRPYGAVDGLVLARRRRGDQSVGSAFHGGHCGRTAACSARRIRSSVEPPWPAKGFSICVTSAGL